MDNSLGLSPFARLNSSNSGAGAFTQNTIVKMQSAYVRKMIFRIATSRLVLDLVSYINGERYVVICWE
jgi:hypothetical protein